MPTSPAARGAAAASPRSLVILRLDALDKERDEIGVVCLVSAFGVEGCKEVTCRPRARVHADSDESSLKPLQVYVARVVWIDLLKGAQNEAARHAISMTLGSLELQRLGHPIGQIGKLLKPLSSVLRAEAQKLAVADAAIGIVQRLLFASQLVKKGGRFLFVQLNATGPESRQQLVSAQNAIAKPIRAEEAVSQSSQPEPSICWRVAHLLSNLLRGSFGRLILEITASIRMKNSPLQEVKQLLEVDLAVLVVVQGVKQPADFRAPQLESHLVQDAVKLVQVDRRGAAFEAVLKNVLQAIEPAPVPTMQSNGHREQPVRQILLNLPERRTEGAFCDARREEVQQLSKLDLSVTVHVESIHQRLLLCLAKHRGETRPPQQLLELPLVERTILIRVDVHVQVFEISDSALRITGSPQPSEELPSDTLDMVAPVRRLALKVAGLELAELCEEEQHVLHEG
mmetsp:Transcript_3042/g.12304  ORF Transcript_3042/g.12304 Transcript_3042/m.12304 type:complete len:456 (+) Transcript_3042:535-1902(+)